MNRAGVEKLLPVRLTLVGGRAVLTLILRVTGRGSQDSDHFLAASIKLDRAVLEDIGGSR
jgi:hypothetical protein